MMQNYQYYKGSIDDAKAYATLQNINISFEDKDLILNASLYLDNEKRYGLVGPKSCGKSTLLKQLAEKKFDLVCDTDVIYWTEDVSNSDISVEDFVVQGNAEVYKKKLEQLKDKQENSNLDPSVKDEIRKLKIELMVLNPKGALAGGRCSRILNGLGFPLKKWWGLIKELPRHLKKKVSLARALFLEPSLLILDEPTNVLDINALIWLESYLQNWKTTLIVVSQDRCFLDVVCQEIIYIDKKQLFQYKGNYSSFEKFLQSQESDKAQVKIQSKATQKNSDGIEFHDNGEEAKKPDFTFLPGECSKILGFLFLTDITYGYKKKKPLFSKMDCAFNYKPVIAVVGDSGVGKSALLRLASGQLKPQKGKVETIPDKISIGIFDEYSMNNLPQEQKLTSYLMETCKIDDREVIKQQLSRLGLESSTCTSKIGDLSLAEKARVILAKFCLIPHDALFMDEPTRYLDLAMINALQKAVYSFKGGVMMVTNNEYLISETECDLCVIENLEVETMDDLYVYKERLFRELAEPVKIPLEYNRKTPLNSDLRPKVISDSEIIDHYIKTTNADPDIKNIGMYFIHFIENHNFFSCFCPTLRPLIAAGRTKELAERRMRILIEWWIGEIIERGEVVPSPP